MAVTAQEEISSELCGGGSGLRPGPRGVGQNKKYNLFQYDGFGQMSRRDRRSKTGGTRRVLHFNWDTQGRMREVKDGSNTKFSALYAGDGERVSKTDDTTGSHLFSFGLHDTGDGGTLYTPGLSQRRGSTDRFFHHDWLGSTRYLSDSAANLPTALRYDAFGRTLAQAGPDNPTPFGFAGAWGYETEGQNHLDLQYLYQRYYDPQIGRFISRDPIRWSGGLNLYGYCLNDPVNETDPSGLVIDYGFLRPGVSPSFANATFSLIQTIKRRGGLGAWIVDRLEKSPHILSFKLDRVNTANTTPVNPAAAVHNNKFRGAGCGSVIAFDPDAVPIGPALIPTSDGSNTPAIVGLMHELIHAHRNAEGIAHPNLTIADRALRQDGAKELANELLREEEKSTSAIENLIRGEWGMGRRLSYLSNRVQIPIPKVAVSPALKTRR